MSLPLCASGFSLVKWDYELDFPHRVVIEMALENWASAEHRAGPPRKRGDLNAILKYLR